jgi:alpha-glucosidase
VPYLYTLFEEAHRSGAPILRPLLFEFPDDPTTYSTDDEFLLGPALLVAPIARPGTEYRHVYLPRGTWVHYWTGRQSLGPVHALAHAPLGQPALYVRANTPVPLWPDGASVSAGGEPPDTLTWLVCVAPDSDAGVGAHYDDAGDGYAHLDGAFVRDRVTCEVAADGVDLTLSREGSGQRRQAHVQFDIRGVARPALVLMDGEPFDDWEHSADWLLIRLGAGVEAHHIHVAAPPTMAGV